MMRLLEGEGNCKSIICPYHAWTYDKQGQLTAAPFMKTRTGFDMTKMKLPEVRCEVWQGWVYLTLNQKAQSLAVRLKELETYIEGYGMAQYRQISSEDEVWDTNWKNLTENFMEGYHLPVAHRKTLGGHFPVNETRFAEKRIKILPYKPSPKKRRPWSARHTRPTKLCTARKDTHPYWLPFIPHTCIRWRPTTLWHLSLQPKGTGQVALRFGAA